MVGVIEQHLEVGSELQTQDIYVSGPEALPSEYGPLLADGALALGAAGCEGHRPRVPPAPPLW